MAILYHLHVLYMYLIDLQLKPEAIESSEMLHREWLGDIILLAMMCIIHTISIIWSRPERPRIHNIAHKNCGMQN